MLHLYLDARGSQLFSINGVRMLDVAPLRYFSRRFSQDPRIDYLSGDFKSPLAMVKMDLTNIQYPDDSFDAIYCSHVLEHIPDDRKAMQELLRVLKADGWAILQVPLDMNLETTLEDPNVQSPEDRDRMYGQRNHVRLYGRDYKDKLESVGFVVTIDTFVQSLPHRDVTRFGLDPTEDIYWCRKNAS